MYHVTIFAQHKKFGIHATGTDVRLKNVTVTHLHYKLPRAAIVSSQSCLSLHRCHFRCCKGILMKTSHALRMIVILQRGRMADMSRDMSRECRVVVVGKTNFYKKRTRFPGQRAVRRGLIGPGLKRFTATRVKAVHRYPTLPLPREWSFIRFGKKDRSCIELRCKRCVESDT